MKRRNEMSAVLSSHQELLRDRARRATRDRGRKEMSASRPEDLDEVVLSARAGRQLHIGDTIALCVQRGGKTYCVSSEGFVELSCSLREVALAPKPLPSALAPPATPAIAPVRPKPRPETQSQPRPKLWSKV